MQTLTEPKNRIKIGPGKLARIQTKREVIQAGFYFFVLSVIAMFLLDGGLEGISDLPSALDAFSRISSLVGTALLLIMLLLTARVPWIDQQFGQDVATLAHKKLGKWAFYLILAHFAASLTSYAITDGRNVVAELGYLVFTFQDFLTATIATLLMILVVVSSFKAVRRKLRYETWFVTHLLSYLSVMLSIPHIFNMGSDLVLNDIHNAIWVFAYVFVGFNILFFRAALPLAKSLLANTTVDRVVRESSDSVSIYIKGRKLNRFGAQAGQFFQVRFLTKELWGQAHPFSISAVPTQNQIRFTIAKRGDATELMQHLTPGTRVILSGPFGVFTQEMRTKRDVVLIAAGIGIPPVRALAEGLAATAGDISILYRTRDESDAPLLEELKQISELRGHNLKLATGSRPANGQWLSHSNISDESELLQLFPSIREADVYLCGPIEFTHRVERSLKKLGIQETSIHSEEYAW
ncbi:MAG: hypothetical protein RL384_986 [Actinomycetota bacterium]